MPAGMFVHAKTENVPLIDKLPVQSKKDAIRQLAIPSWQYRPLNEDAIDGIMNLTYKAGPTDGN